MSDIVILPILSHHAHKDQQKANICNKFIGRGSRVSSTQAYCNVFAAVNKANVGEYTQEDYVFVSVEGARQGRIALDAVEVVKAIYAGASIITDNPTNRERRYNIGERQLAVLLHEHGCDEQVYDSFSIWRKVSLV